MKSEDDILRLCVDYWKINKITKKDVNPLPRKDDSLDRIWQAWYFTSVDLHSGYWKIAVDEHDRNKTVYYSRWPVSVSGPSFRLSFSASYISNNDEHCFVVPLNGNRVWHAHTMWWSFLMHASRTSSVFSQFFKPFAQLDSLSSQRSATLGTENLTSLVT